MAEVHTAGPASAPLTYFRNPKTAAPNSETFHDLYQHLKHDDRQTAQIVTRSDL